jgi:hypothetical protein
MTSAGRAGLRSRPAMTWPPTAPAARALEMSPQARAPPRSCRAITGPSTASGASTIREKHVHSAVSSHSHRRRPNAANPSASWRTAPVTAPRFRGGVIRGTPALAMAHRRGREPAGQPVPARAAASPPGSVTSRAVAACVASTSPRRPAEPDTRSTAKLSVTGRNPSAVPEITRASSTARMRRAPRREWGRGLVLPHAEHDAPGPRMGQGRGAHSSSPAGAWAG